MAYYDPAGASDFREGHCSLCLHDKSSAAIDFYPYNISCTLDRLRESATEKCKFCALMVDAVLWTISTALVKEDQLESVRLCQGLFLRVKGQSKSLEVEFLDHEGPCGYPSYGRGKEKGHLKAIPGDTASKQTFDTISAWLQDCLANHDECPSPKVHERDSSARRPTRLLDLSNHAVRLREDAPTGGYACLSHRWGEPKSMFCLKTDTLERFKVEIPHDMLPQSFKDAVDICRRLSISLLWIDALCIVQDDRDDWKREAPRMADIYEHAVITIAAAAAHDGAGGCYQLARAEHRGTSLPSRPDVHVRVRPAEYPGFGSNSRDWPLMSRGWIYQEMRLSPRKLHFAASEVIWDCARGRRSESGTNDRDYAPTKDWMRLSDRNLRLRWYRVVAAYTALDLTFESDRLPALSALTERMERLRGGDQFLVGLWKTTLLLDLLWYAMPMSDDVKVRKAAVKTFPSWTWVSMSARIS
ncbi:HET-domain-containing protein [Coniochaeta sp. PMI_546]|nr:HET-domain-containing protein [Coniochaeta sp. PMI_546]